MLSKEAPHEILYDSCQKERLFLRRPSTDLIVKLTSKFNPPVILKFTFILWVNLSLVILMMKGLGFIMI